MYTIPLNNSVDMPMHGIFLIDEETTAKTVYTAIKFRFVFNPLAW